MERTNVLIIFSGLPGTGKTSIAKAVAKRISASYLRVDTIEQSFIRSGILGKDNLKDYGYHTAYSIASDNLDNGICVVADSVNPIALTRDAWRNVALKANVNYLEVEIICSDKKEHKRRVEERKPDIYGAPTWKDVCSRDYERWACETLLIDTSKVSIEEAVSIVLAKKAETNKRDSEKMSFFEAFDELIKTNGIIIERPKNSRHPRFPDLIYPLDYGYISGTQSQDGQGIDVYSGDDKSLGVVGVMCTIDSLKKDSEIKVMYRCTDENIKSALKISNNEYMYGFFIRR